MINLLLGVATMVVVPGELSVNRTKYLGKLEEFLWDMRAKWDALGIQLGISMGTCEVQSTTLPSRVIHTLGWYKEFMPSNYSISTVALRL